MLKPQFYFPIVAALNCLLTVQCVAQSKPTADIRLSLQKRTESDSLPGTFTISQSIKSWNPNETAIIICDMWNQHWCKGATERVAEMAPRMNEVVKKAREQGVFIIHAPSETM